mmetsp:Transcript_88968/g.250556  ORF Transcript_88968/g.250556 Transcript_88968/m.250556 type:complete len:208 (-) Transcript_88968:139-762(-)
MSAGPTSSEWTAPSFGASVAIRCRRWRSRRRCAWCLASPRRHPQRLLIHHEDEARTQTHTCSVTLLEVVRHRESLQSRGDRDDRGVHVPDTDMRRAVLHECEDAIEHEGAREVTCVVNELDPTSLKHLEKECPRHGRNQGRLWSAQLFGPLVLEAIQMPGWQVNVAKLVQIHLLQFGLLLISFVGCAHNPVKPSEGQEPEPPDLGFR